jgi:hypothetical protein
MRIRAFRRPVSGASMSPARRPAVPLRCTAGFNPPRLRRFVCYPAALLDSGRTVVDSNDCEDLPPMDLRHLFVERPSVKRRRRDGLKPGVQRSGTPGPTGIAFVEPLTRGDGERYHLQIPLVERQTMRAQNHLKFLQERNAPMMFFLALDVSIYFRHQRFAYGEGAVSLLPRESGSVFECTRNPNRRVCFQFAHQFRQRLVLPQFCEDVDVIRRAIHNQSSTAFAANGTAKIFMNSGSDRRPHPRFAVLRRKDNVIKEIAIGGTHGRPRFPSPLSKGSTGFYHIPGVPVCSTPAFIPPRPSGAQGKGACAFALGLIVDWSKLLHRSGVGNETHFRLRDIPAVPRSTPGFIPPHPSGGQIRTNSGVALRAIRDRSRLLHSTGIGNDNHSRLQVQRRRRDGLKPGVKRSGTPGCHRIQKCRTPERGDGPNESRDACAVLEHLK